MKTSEELACPLFHPPPPTMQHWNHPSQTNARKDIKASSINAAGALSVLQIKSSNNGNPHTGITQKRQKSHLLTRLPHT